MSSPSQRVEPLLKSPPGSRCLQKSIKPMWPQPDWLGQHAPWCPASSLDCPLCPRELLGDVKTLHSPLTASHSKNMPAPGLKVANKAEVLPCGDCLLVGASNTLDPSFVPLWQWCHTGPIYSLTVCPSVTSRRLMHNQSTLLLKWGLTSRLAEAAILNGRAFCTSSTPPIFCNVQEQLQWSHIGGMLAVHGCSPHTLHWTRWHFTKDPPAIVSLGPAD